MLHRRSAIKSVLVLPAAALAAALMLSACAGSAKTDKPATSIDTHSTEINAGTTDSGQSEPADNVAIDKNGEPDEEVPEKDGPYDETASGKESAELYTFTDDLGREVSVRHKPERVAALVGSFADIWANAGGADSIVASANDTWTYFDIDLKEDVVNLGATKDISLENLLLCEPELVLASTNTELDLQMMEPLEAAGIPTAYFEVSGFDDYLRMLNICTEITERRDLYEANGTAVSGEVSDAIKRADGSRPSVLYIRASKSSLKVKNSVDSVLGEMLNALDCRNIADSEDSLLEELSLEVILKEDPEHIFIVYQAADPTEAEKLMEDTLTSSPAWASLTAVKNGNVHIMDQKLYNLKPNAKWGEAYQQLADILYGKK